MEMQLVLLLQNSNILLAPKVLQNSNILEVAQKGAFCYNMFLR